MKDSIEELRNTCQRSSYEAWNTQPWLFLQIRKISIYVTWVLLHTPLTPNAISLLAVCFGVVASIALAMDQLIAGLILIQLTIILDFSDGEVSRYRNERSKEGSYLDKIYVFLVHPCLFAGIALFEFQANNQFPILVAGFTNVISVFVFCMVVEYARQIVVWRHFMKFIFSSVSVSELTLRNVRMNAPANTPVENRMSTSRFRGFYDGARYFMRKARINELLKLWDFPYMFLAMSFAIVLEIIFSSEPTRISLIRPISIYLYFYAISYPIIILCILSKNLQLRAIQSDYEGLTATYLEMLSKRFLRNRSP